MFSTSADILNLILAVCVATLTFFLSLSLYYFISSAQKIHRLISRLEEGVVKAEEVVNLIREKLKSGSAYLVVLAELAKKALDLAKNKEWNKGFGEEADISIKTKKKTKKK